MTLASQINSLATRAGAEDKALRTLINGNAADLAALLTTDKSSLVSAINELKTFATGVISDGSQAATTTWSSDKIVSELVNLQNTILGGASAAYDTLLEIQNELQGNDTEIATILTNQSNKVGVTAQTFTAPEQLQARTNIGAVAAADIGNTASDFVATFDAALV